MKKHECQYNMKPALLSLQSLKENIIGVLEMLSISLTFRVYTEMSPIGLGSNQAFPCEERIKIIHSCQLNGLEKNICIEIYPAITFSG